jgi:hypothetical protein
MKLIKIPVVLLLVLASLVATEEPLKKNQLTAFPNTSQAPTMAKQIPDSSTNFSPPKLSHSLFETDPKKKLRKAEFMENIKWSLYKLTRGELEQIFDFSDQNHDDLIDQTEWDAFTTLYILPFEACDSNADYLLDAAEFKTCFNADPKSKLLQWRRKYRDQYYSYLMSVVSSRGNEQINFSDYLFIKKSLFGWQQCHSNAKYIAMSHFRCAMKVTVPQKYHLKINMEDMYKVGIKMANDRALIELDFVAYVRVLYFAYIFSIYGMPHDSPFLEQTQFIKSIREDRFPQNWEESEVNQFYDLINTNPLKKNNVMNFETFAFYFTLHRLFNKYSIEKPLQINDQELQNLLSDRLCPMGVAYAIDLAKTNLPESAYLESSLVLQKKRPNEGNFYFGFKETSSNLKSEKANTDTSKKGTQDASVTSASFFDKNNIDNEYQDVKPNADNRHVFFTLMSGTDKKFWSKEIYYRAFTLSNLFVSMCHDKRWIVSVPYFLDKLNSYYDIVSPPISQVMRKNFVRYKYLPREVSLDILAFLALENWEFKIDQVIKSSNDYINETLLKVILSDFGMINMPDTVIDTAKKGYDNLRRRQFFHEEALKSIIIVHSTAAETERNKESLKDYKLRINDDDSRKYPDLPRRFMSSPNV